MEILLFAISIILFYLLHSFLANNNVKSFLQQRLISKKYYRIVYNFIAIITLLLLFYFYKNLNSHFIYTDKIIQRVGLFLTIIGGILGIIALRQYQLSEFIGIQQLSDKSEKKSNPLKTTGFNSIVRHPLYFATLCLLWGLFMYHPTDLVLIVASLSSLYIYFGTKLEEQKLIEEFGDAYIEYQQNVNMLIPSPPYFFQKK